MPTVTVIRRLQFSSAHRVHNPALSDGEKSAAALDYAPIPSPIEKQLLTRLDKVKAK